MQDKEEYLLELLETTDYNDLSEQDLKFVNSQIGEEEYNNSRLNLLAMNGSFENDIEAITVDYSMLESLHKRDKKPIGILRTIIGLQFSFVRVAAVFIAFFISYSLLLATLTSSGSEVEIRYVTKVDTVFQKEIIKLVDTIFIENTVIVKESNPNPVNKSVKEAIINKPTTGKRNLKEAYAPVVLAQLEKAKRSKNRGISKKNEESIMEIRNPISEYSSFEMPIGNVE